MRSVRVKAPRRRLLGLWAVLGLGAIVFSYALSLAAAVACVILPLIAFRHNIGGVVSIMTIPLGMIMAGAILWSLVPRREKFKPPGVPIDLARELRLKDFIDRIALDLGERAPADVYLIPEANAFVTERGGFLGLGRKRIMGLGLPIVATMSVSELRAVLAHEFAHFYSGDTRLGPKIYRTRSAIARTLTNLSSDSEVVGFLTRFGLGAALYAIVIGGLTLWWKLFLRTTQLISRAQEYRSDELACYIGGSDAMARGLERVNRLGSISQLYWESVALPVIAHGYRPPLAEGLHRFFSLPHVQRAASASIAFKLRKKITDPYDTHPPLKLRLERISETNADSEYPPDPSPAVALLEDVDGLEEQLIQAIVPNVKSPLAPVDWESAGATVWLPAWRKFVTEYRNLLAGYTVSCVPALLQDLPGISRGIRNPPGMLLGREQRIELAADLIWMALAIRLADEGWTVHMEPGEFSLSKGEDGFIVPLLVVRLRRNPKTCAADWQNWCRLQCVGDLPLAAA